MSSNNCDISPIYPPYRQTCRGLSDETETDPKLCVNNGCCYDAGNQPHCYKSYPDAKCPWYKGADGEHPPRKPIKKPRENYQTGDNTDPCDIYPPYRMGVHNIANQADCEKSGAGTNCWDSTAQGGSGDNTGRAIPSCYLPFSESVCPWLGPPGPPKPCTQSGGLYNTQADCEDKMDGFGNNVGNEWCCDPNKYNPDNDGTNCQGPCYYKCPKHGWSSQNKKCLCENGWCPDIYKCAGSKCVSGVNSTGAYCNPAQGGNCYEGLTKCQKNCK